MTLTTSLPLARREEFAAATAAVAVRLANEPSSQVLAHAVTGRATLAAAVAPLWQAAGRRWRGAALIAARHVALVLANNPEREPAEVLGRRDVAEALQQPFERAWDLLERDLQAAWRRGVQAGLRQARADMASLGMTAPPGVPDVDRSVLTRLLADVATNRAAHMSRMANRIQTAADPAAAITAVANDEAHRARAGLSTAGAEGYSAAQRAAYARAAQEGGYTVRLMWVTHFRPGTCGTCAALHGTTVALGEEFDPEAHFGAGRPPRPYGDFQGPPRHPNCGCRLVPYIDAVAQQQARLRDPESPLRRSDGDGPTPATLQRFARGWWSTLLGKVKRLFGG